MEVESAIQGLESVLSGKGFAPDSANNFITKFTKDGLVSISDASSAYKNMIAANYSPEQAQSIMSNLKDTAAYNRQGSLGMGEAIVGATEGIKNQNSVLVDNAGVTRNLSKM